MLNREHPSSKRTQLTLCMCRFASVTVNLGPTFLSGALAANAGAVMDEPSCPLVQVTGHQQGANTVIVHIWSSRHVSCVLRIGGQKQKVPSLFEVF